MAECEVIPPSGRKGASGTSASRPTFNRYPSSTSDESSNDEDSRLDVELEKQLETLGCSPTTKEKILSKLQECGVYSKSDLAEIEEGDLQDLPVVPKRKLMRLVKKEREAIVNIQVKSSKNMEALTLETPKVVLPFNKYIGIHIGKGVYFNEKQPIRENARVFHGKYMALGGSGEQIAVKIVSSEELREVGQILKLRNHQNIVSFKVSGDFRYRGLKSMFIAMELCGQTLDQKMNKSREYFSSSQSKLVLLHIGHGLLHMHSQSVLHRDLKPSNILFSQDEKWVKIGDFGLSKNTDLDKSESIKSLESIGTVGWASPESYISSEKVMSKKSDVFSYGLVSAYVLTKGGLAFGNDIEEQRNGVMMKSEPDLNKIKGDDELIARDFISGTLKMEPEMRPNIAEILSHPFFWSERERLNFLQQATEFLVSSKHQKNIGRKPVNPTKCFRPTLTKGSQDVGRDNTVLEYHKSLRSRELEQLPSALQMILSEIRQCQPLSK